MNQYLSGDSLKKKNYYIVVLSYNFVRIDISATDIVVLTIELRTISGHVQTVNEIS